MYAVGIVVIVVGCAWVGIIVGIGSVGVGRVDACVVCCVEIVIVVGLVGWGVEVVVKCIV